MLAVIVWPLIPNDTLLELLNVNAVAFVEVVPAEMLILPPPPAPPLAVITPTRSMPKLIPLALENVKSERAELVVPAEI